MFKNLHELFTKMPTEQDCRNYLAAQRWVDGKPVCPSCDNSKCYTILGGKRYKCSDKKCNRQFSVVVGTVFECSNLPLSKWFYAIYVATAHKKGISSHQLARDLGITQKSAWFVLHRVREITGCKVSDKMDGIIEIDEVYVGGKNHNKHKKERAEINKLGTGYMNKVGVLGILQRGKEVRLKVIGLDNQGVYLKPIIRENVAPTAQIVTDGFGGYKDLKFEFTDHQIVNHSQDEFVRGEWHTNGIEGFFSHFRRMVYGVYHSVTPKHLASYCNECAYRYNTRELKDHERFTLSLRNVSGRLTHKALIAR